MKDRNVSAEKDKEEREDRGDKEMPVGTRFLQASDVKDVPVVNVTVEGLHVLLPLRKMIPGLHNHQTPSELRSSSSLITLISYRL